MKCEKRRSQQYLIKRLYINPVNMEEEDEINRIYTYKLI